MDQTLLEYVRTGSDETFARLVESHLDLVYAAAMRQVRERALAEDVTQAVFMLLHRKARGLSEQVVLAGWLIRAAHFASRDALKREQRRKYHERKAAAMAAVSIESSQTQIADAEAWQNLSPVLDAGLAALGDADRSAVALRYLNGKSNRDVADSLGVSEDAAEKRISRAVGKLRKFFASRGIEVTPSVLAMAAATGATPGAGLSASIVSAAAAGAAQAGSAAWIARSAGRAMFWTHAKLAGAAAACVAVLIVGTIAVAALKPAASRNVARPAPFATLELRIVDGTSGLPIPNAPLRVGVDYGGYRRDRVTTDANGIYVIDIPRPNPRTVIAFAKVDKYVPTSVAWSDDPPRGGVPSKYTLKLERGTALGGVVKDEQGRPVAGATINFSTHSNGLEGENQDVWDWPSKTDANGKWQIDYAPAEPVSFAIRPSHPDYLEPIGAAMYDKATLAPFRALRGEHVLPTGIAVEGFVKDANFNPVKGAQVVEGANRWGRDDPPVITDARGYFKLKALRPQPTVITVTAKGFGPAMAEVAPTKGMAALQFKLEKGRTIRGHVVETTGIGPGTAHLGSFGWRGHSSLTWRIDADAEGYFTYNDAPIDAFTLNVNKDGSQERRYEVKPGDNEPIIKLSPALRVRGTVVDANSGSQIQTFRIVPGITWQKDATNVSWEERDGIEFKKTGGKFDVPLPDDYPFRHLRIEADGYAPAESRAFKSDEGPVAWDAKLKPATAKMLAVVSAKDGRPLSGAEVWLFDTWDGFAELHENRPEPGLSSHRKLGVTGSDGKFKLPSSSGAQTWGYVVIHESGVAVASPEDVSGGKVVAIEPYGRVEGIVMIGAKPAAGATVSVHSPQLNFASGNPNERPKGLGLKVECRAVADPSGRFVVEKMMSGAMCAARWEMTEGNHGWVPRGFTGQPNVTVKSGETAKVTVGGMGRPVIGRFVAPAGVSLEGISASLRREWPDEYCQIDVKPDGTFRVEDVTGGLFRIYATVYAPEKPGQHAYHPQAGVDEKHLILPSPGGRTDEVHDLGEIQLKPAK